MNPWKHSRGGTNASAAGRQVGSLPHRRAGRVFLGCLVLLGLSLAAAPARSADPDPLWVRGEPETSGSPSEKTPLHIHNDGSAPFSVQIVWTGGIWSSRVPPGGSRMVDVKGGGRVDYVLSAGQDSVTGGFDVAEGRTTDWKVAYTGESASAPAALPSSVPGAEVGFEVPADDFQGVEKMSADEKIQVLEGALAGKYRGHEKMTEALAVLHNNRGLALEKEERWDDAFFHMNRALQLEPEDRTIRTNLAILRHNRAVKMMDADGFPAAEREVLAALEIARGLGKEAEAPILSSYAEMLTKEGISNADAGRPDSAERLLRRALELKPESVVAWVRLGEIQYDRHDLAGAAESYRRAVAILPRDDLKERLARIERELSVAGDFTTSEVGRFIISFQGNENEGLARDVRSILRNSYRDVGRIFHYYPREEIPVVIYNSGQFLHVTQLHGWAGAVFDGKIRLRVDPDDKRDRKAMLARLKEQIDHEYTHALIHFMTGGAKVPVWLHEGLAQYVEDQSQPGNDEKMMLAAEMAHGALPGLANLAGPFAGISDSNRASLAYLESKHFVRFLIDRFGFSRMGRFLSQLGSGTTVESAAESAFGRPLSDLEAQWREGLS